MKTTDFYKAISRRCKEGPRRRMREGRFTGRAPVGYRNVQDEYGFGAIEPNPEKAEIVRRMYAMREKGRSVREIARAAAESGLLGRSGRPLSVAGVHWILNCPTYRGLVRTPEGELVRGTHEAILQPLNDDDLLTVPRNAGPVLDDVRLNEVWP